MTLTPEYRLAIVQTLNHEYTQREINEMLATATFEETDIDFCVIYDNGNVDRFLKITTLKHAHSL